MAPTARLLLASILDPAGNPSVGRVSQSRQIFYVPLRSGETTPRLPRWRGASSCSDVSCRCDHPREHRAHRPVAI
jgi:hypothetical protein